MRLGVLSDTHGHLTLTRQAAARLAALRVDVVLHCGDIGSNAIPPLLANWPANYVLGNVDPADPDELAPLAAAIAAAGGVLHGRVADLTLGGRRIAAVHGDDAQRLQAALTCGDYDLVCFGHTHRAERRREGGTLVLNPGAVFRARPHSVACVDLASMTVEEAVW